MKTILQIRLNSWGIDQVEESRDVNNSKSQPIPKSIKCSLKGIFIIFVYLNLVFLIFRDFIGEQAK